ncbi:hybrid sensor histidine kinase/response regulator [Gordonibacter sp. An230]|uniref:hybrid sensor histidine kinase/response regulator n=1 Tax=Gordonibacter sp. An230 TaxID=1965592 RepID=UPI000B389A6C|nr:ATP-binding protein [Gordonibacter sp. An230]OUO92413.1 hybrid sensor histidine kinase/response regulator [Gordonibacter sp. An230]
MTTSASESGSERESLLNRLLNSNVVFGAAVAMITALLVCFYGMLQMNMDEINIETEALKDRPYTVAVAAGRVETLLMQVRTLDDRLAFTRSHETVDSVWSEFADIDGELREKLAVVVDRHSVDTEKAQSLASQYEEFRSRQNQLIEIAATSDNEEVVRFLERDIDPFLDSMLKANADIIADASRSFDQLYETAAETRADTLFTATVLMVAVVAAFALFIVVIRRKNRQQEHLQVSLQHALECAQEANEAKSRFVSNVSHDIRTPLTAIIGLTDIALEHASEEARVSESLEKIKLSSHHLLNLVNDVLDMSKIESGRIEISHEPFDVRDLVEMMASIARPQADTKHLSFIVGRCDVRPGLVMGDEVRVSQVLINLLGNAVKYTEPYGTVRFSVTELDEEEVRHVCGEGLCDPHAAVSEGRVLRVMRFVVEDDGVGMSSEFVSHIFDPFEREDAPSRSSVEGTGLGMTIAKSLVERMGGSINVESARGRGSRFTLLLPVEHCEGDDEARDESEPIAVPCKEKSEVEIGSLAEFEGAWPDAHVLLAEDDEIVGEIAEELIGRTGADIDRAWNGAEAVELLERAPAGTYDLVFMDVQMPRMDGLEAARAIVDGCERSGRAHPPIIAMTANAYVEDRKRAYDAGMDGYAVKPIDEEEIVELFRTYVPLDGKRVRGRAGLARSGQTCMDAEPGAGAASEASGARLR